MAESKFTVEPIETEAALMEKMSEPSPEVVEAVSQIDGEVMILGVAGKIGPTLGRMLVRAGAKGIIGVDRDQTEAPGIQMVQCDLLDEEGLRQLPDAGHIFLLAGLKFGSTDNQALTWAMNTMLPARVMQRFPKSRIVYVSSGNVYRYAAVDSGGATESDPVEPIGEYAESRLGGERLVEFLSEQNSTPVAIIRLFYATELRYGIILDIAQKVWNRTPVDLTMGHVNQIWQGDVCAYLARSFAFCESPAQVINLTGAETLSVRELALQLGSLMGKEPILEGKESETALLGNTQEMVRRLGPPKVGPREIVEWAAWWMMHGGATLGKPTKYESRTGKF